MCFKYYTCSIKHPDISSHISYKDRRKEGACGAGVSFKLSELLAFYPWLWGPGVPVSSPCSHSPVEKSLRMTSEILCHSHPGVSGSDPDTLPRGPAQSWDLPETRSAVCPPSSQPPLHSWTFWVICGYASDLCLASLTCQVLLCASEEEQSLGQPGLWG